MRFIPTRVHGILDYTIGALLIAAPWLLGFASEGADTVVPVVLGAAVILYSALTDYEVGLMRLIPMSGHLGLDVVGGLLLAASPWLFGFVEYVWIPHVVVGLLEVIAAACTHTHPDDRVAHGELNVPAMR